MPVCLLGVPVDLFLRSAQHADDVVRELWLMALTHGQSAHADYTRLADEADACAGEGAELRNATVEHVLRARAAGRKTVDLELVVPVATAQRTLDWDSLLDEMDNLCEQGVLLSLSSAGEVQQFRRWYVGEIVRQIQHGQPPTAYREWRRHGWSAAAPHPTGA